MNDPQAEGHMASHIGRRKFLATLGGAAAAWPLPVRGQQPERMVRICVLMSNAADDPRGLVVIAAFMQWLQERGWTVGRNLRIDIRWGAGDADRYRTYSLRRHVLNSGRWRLRGTSHCSRASSPTSATAFRP